MPEEDISQINPLDLRRERGIDADKILVDELVEAISSKWEVPAESPKQPVILLMGGFQGAGKTSITDHLSPRLPLLVISPDEIRHAMFQRISFSATFVHSVNAARNRLIEKALATGQHIVLDENATPTRMSVYKSLLKNSTYKVLLAFFNTPKDILIKRLRSRPDIQGKYKGTVDELEASMKMQGEPDLGNFDLVFQTDKQSPEEISEKLLQRVNNLQ